MTLRALIHRAAELARQRFDPRVVTTPHFLAQTAEGSVSLFEVQVEPDALEMHRRVTFPNQLLNAGYRLWVYWGQSRAIQDDGSVVSERVEDLPEVILFEGFDARRDLRLRAWREIDRTGGGWRLLPLEFAQFEVAEFPAVPGAEVKS